MYSEIYYKHSYCLPTGFITDTVPLLTLLNNETVSVFFVKIWLSSIILTMSFKSDFGLKICFLFGSKSDRSFFCKPV